MSLSVIYTQIEVIIDHKWPLTVHLLKEAKGAPFEHHQTLVTCLLTSFYPLIAAAVCQGQGGQMRSPGDNRELIPATNIIYNRPLSPQYLIGDRRITLAQTRLTS